VTRLLRALSAFLCLCLAGVGPVLVAAPAEASVTILCKGYAGCKQAGMGNAGYRTYGW
jgi:hypothetical protein